MKVAPFFTHSI